MNIPDTPIHRQKTTETKSEGVKEELPHVRSWTEKSAVDRELDGSEMTAKIGSRRRGVYNIL